MVQGYYTLQEAARHLNISLDELKMMAQKGKIRSFQDRGTLRFRIQDIQELARQRGVSSDPDLVLGEASLPPKKGSGPRAPKSPASPKTPSKDSVPEVFDFELDDESVDLGEGLLDVDASSKKGPGSGGKPKSGPKGKSGPVLQAKEPPRSGAQPKSPIQVKSGAQPRSGKTPKSGGIPRDMPGSDSDVKLVASASAEVTGNPDSDIRLRDKGSAKMPATPAVPKSGGKSGGKPGAPPSSDPTKKRPSRLGPRTPSQPDSGVRLVAMDSDSDVKIVGTGEDVPLGEQPAGTLADSNVRLEKVAFPPSPADSGAMLTEEINLDEELQKEEQRLKDNPRPPTRVKPKSQLKFPTTSPFELSDSDIEAPAAPDSAASPADSSDFEMTAAAGQDSSNFELTPPQEDSSNFDLPVTPGDSSNFEIAKLKDDSSGNFELTPASPAGSSDDDFSLELDDSSEVDLGAASSGGELSAPASGINLSRPIDAGISLEEQKASDDNIEFDLSLEPEATPKPAQMKDVEGDDSSSEFELSLELDESEGAGKPVAAPGPDDSDSEFELTLDDSSGEMQADESTAQVKAGDDEATQDIFESDFEIPALEQEGAAEPATVDTELESSDFDLALDDSELAADEESGSQVVALDEEEVEPVGDEEIEVTAEEEEGEFADLEAEGEEEVEVEDTRPPREVEVVKLLRPAPWGVLPTIVMFPCVIVMLLVGLVGFEMVQSSVGHRPPGMMTRALADVMAQVGLPANFKK
jgi:excisionase family DNA binding protein